MPTSAAAVPLLPFHRSSLNLNTEAALWVDGFALTLTFYLRYLCPVKGKRVNQHVGYDFNAALAMREAKEREINALRLAEANGLKVERPADASDQNRLKVNAAIDQYFRNLYALGKDPKTIRAYRKAVDQFRESCTKQYLDEIGKQDLIAFMGWLRTQPQRRQRNANPDRTHFNKVMSSSSWRLSG